MALHRYGLSAAVFASLAGTTSSLWAQQPSLASLAAKEAERRQAITQPSRIYTNADVKPAESNPAPNAAAPVVPALGQPDVKSDHDLVRERGADDFERAAQVLAQQADDLDNERQRYNSACKGSSPRVVFGGQWMWIDNESLPECLLLRSDIASLTKAIRMGLDQALEDARRADVYPGTVRDIRRKYSLEGPDWDR